MGQREGRYVDFFYETFTERVAIGVGYAQNLEEVFPFVLRDRRGKALGIVAMAALSLESGDAVHIFHFSAFSPQHGDGGRMLEILCRKADELRVVLSLSPVPAPNGNDRQIGEKKLVAWYRHFGFAGNALLRRIP